MSVKELLEQPVLSKPREKILKALGLEPFMTTRQLARLFYRLTRKGEPAKSHSIRVRNLIVELEPGYYPAYRLLRKMAKDGLIKKHKPDFRGLPDLWSLPRVRQPKNWYGRQHEIDCADLFVSLVHTRAMDHWDVGWQKGESEFKALGVRYDRRLELADVRPVVFIEVDRGSEDLDTIETKLRKYSELDRKTDDHFVVVFTVQGYRWTDAKARADAICKLAARFQRGSQILVTPFAAFREDPLGKCLILPGEPEKSISLYDI